MNDVYISKNFKLWEFQCKDGSCLVKVDEGLVEKLQQLRDHFKKPIIINSGYRTESYNKRIGGAKKSQHVLGKACDVRIDGVEIKDIAEKAIELGFTGIGIYEKKGFCHLDVRDRVVNSVGRRYDIWSL